MSRRRFLQQVSAWSAGLAVAAPLFRIAPNRAMAAVDAAPMLTVGQGTDYVALVAKVLEPLGGIGAFVKSGDRVVVKPNIGWDRTPQQAANTHPDVVKALVQLALDAGAKKVSVFDRTCNDARRSYANSGIQPAVESIGSDKVECSFVDDRKFVPVRIENGRSLNEWTFYKDALDVDCYINVPIAKHHSRAKLTLGLKNVMGVMGGKRGDIHPDLGQCIADLNMVVAPKLTVIDATRILLRNGPTGGNLADVEQRDTLIASRDIVATDAYATHKLFNLDPRDIPAVTAAYDCGMGQMDLDKMNVVEV
ncbi:MAG: DUF362 domain-containing protein [Phycisphaeraceae bacterium]|nr:DUF362 domain-containing protein [Phycisphaeraceae bacterium]